MLENVTISNARHPLSLGIDKYTAYFFFLWFFSSLSSSRNIVSSTAPATSKAGVSIISVFSTGAHLLEEAVARPFRRSFEGGHTFSCDGFLWFFCGYMTFARRKFS